MSRRMRRLFLAAAGLGLTFGAAGRAEADILAQLTTQGAFTLPYIEGQSVTTTVGGPFDNITFNFYSDTAASSPTAPGTLFILDRPYNGSPVGLATLGPTQGLIGSVTGDQTGFYHFLPAVQLTGGTQYFFYENVLSQFAITTDNNPNDYPGGTEWSTTGTNTAFGPAPNGDVLFTLSGTAVSVVPEPSTAVVAVFGAVSGIAYGLARKRRAQRRQDQEGTSEQTQ